jgi:PAS domain S-box-containing protein
VKDRTAELSREHQNSQTLLRIITELSASLDLGQVLNRTLAVINETVGSEQSLILLAQGSGIPYQAGTPLVIINGAGKDPAVEKEIAIWVARQRTPALVDDIRSDPRWEFPNDWHLEYRSVLAVPLVVGEDILGTLLLLHRSPAFFLFEQVGILEAAARQIGISLNNAELFTLIRDQAERLGSMLRVQTIEATRSRAILEAVADGVLVTDAEGRIALFNASAESILDLKSAQVSGQSLDHFIGLFGKAARTWMHTIRLWSTDPSSYQLGETYSEQIELDNGKIVSVHLAPVAYRTQYYGTVSIFRDITREVQLDRLKSEFVANVSHELRTPMTSIKGYVDIMLMGASGALSDQQNHFLKIVKANIERLSVLVNDLLDISRIESGRITLNYAPIDMKDLAADVVADVLRRSREENKPMDISLDIPEGLPRVAGDLDRMRQILGSLVMNGYNYTPAEGRVVVKARVENHRIQVDVSDTGIGVDPQMQSRIFERFYRGEDPLVLATAGTGLGLAVAKMLIEMHHGKIWFNSKGVRGEGSTFSFTLPLAQPEE